MCTEWVSRRYKNYGEAFVTAVNSFVADNPNPSGSTTGERPQTVLSDEEAAETAAREKRSFRFTSSHRGLMR